MRHYKPSKTAVDFPRFEAFCASRGGYNAVGRAIGYGSSTLASYKRTSTVSNKALLEIERHYGVPYRLFLPDTPQEKFDRWMKAHKIPQKPKPKLCDARCRGCQYGSGEMFGPTVTACLYILRTGKRRPCAAGAECTEFTKGDRRIYVPTSIL